MRDGVRAATASGGPLDREDALGSLRGRDAGWSTAALVHLGVRVLDRCPVGTPEGHHLLVKPCLLAAGAPALHCLGLHGEPADASGHPRDPPRPAPATPLSLGPGDDGPRPLLGSPELILGAVGAPVTWPGAVLRGAELRPAQPGPLPSWNQPIKLLTGTGPPPLGGEASRGLEPALHPSFGAAWAGRGPREGRRAHSLGRSGARALAEGDVDRGLGGAALVSQDRAVDADLAGVWADGGRVVEVTWGLPSHVTLQRPALGVGSWGQEQLGAEIGG